ncbi:MAG: DUF5684 domain-containing protein [Lachnospiraceae bacterium]
MIESMQNMSMETAKMIVYLVPVTIIVLVVMQVIGIWKIFSKTGVAKWKALIPVYNLYYLYKLSWELKMYWLYIASQAVMVVTTILFRNTTSMLPVGVTVIACMLGIILHIASSNKLAECFRQGMFVSFGLILFRPLFLLYLGAAQTQYVGPQKY